MQLHSKRNRYVKRVLLALLIFVLSFSAISMIVTVIFFHTAFPRSDTPSDFSYSYSQMESAGYPYQKVEFPSGNNMLTGYYCEADGSAEIKIDKNELKLALWKLPAEIELQPDSYSLTNEMMRMFKEHGVFWK